MIVFTDGKQQLGLDQSKRQAVRSSNSFLETSKLHRYCYDLLNRRSSEGIGICTSSLSSNPTLAKYNDNLRGSNLAVMPPRDIIIYTSRA